ncbi:sugar phosphate isomerase/epimerase family protein [Rhodococcus sp. OK302]|uniref:sugar phosphate isomerase/epimerase family protein n=1 Tax=Rhodococcus sp. OK302 TaxID=1882769 RepID=UPI000B9EF7B5|nr:sugar phosphate isomerase/epimerase family protein [Rhodococcus sp. OK302]OYD70791.1 sugar phosphate isomerase/epimerase [Rhodococcus sp. OK302]
MDHNDKSRQMDLVRGPFPSVSLITTASWALRDELALCRRLGISAVALSAYKAGRTGWPETVSLAREFGVAVGCIAHGITADPDDGTAWEGEIAALDAAVVGAAGLGAPTVLFTTGPSGRLSWEDAADRLIDHVSPVAERAKQLGVRLSLENTMQMRSDLSFVHTVRDAAVIARRLDIGMVVDLYCAFQEPDLLGTLRAELDRVQIVQVADFRVGTLAVPNRWVPGDGDLPMDRLLREVLGLGYRGAVELEILGPAIEEEGPESALRRAYSWLTAELAVDAEMKP